MYRILMIADDLTGSNANCALLKKVGLSSASITGNDPEQINKKIDVISLTTDSRAMDSRIAYKKVYEKLQVFNHSDIEIYSKRIDSTLRGNLGSELQAYLDFLGDDYKAICVPSYPDSGRISVSGKLYVNGKPLMNTDAGNDPKVSAVSNYVIENFKKDFNESIELIDIEEIETSVDKLSRKIIEKFKNNRLLVFDSITNEQIDIIAKASLHSEIPFICVDPGPFTQRLAKLSQNNANKEDKKVVAVIGSVTNKSIIQLKNLKKQFKVNQVNVDPIRLIDEKTRYDEIKNCSNKGVSELENKSLLVLTTTPDRVEDRVDLSYYSKKFNISIDDISLIISRGLAKVFKNITSKCKIDGLFSSGGDITVAINEELYSQGIEVEDEVIPLVAYGKLIGGLQPGLKIVSKGGIVGEEDAMIQCINKLL